MNRGTPMSNSSARKAQAERDGAGVGEDFETLADWLGTMPEAHNVFDITDEATTVITIDVETLAERLAADRARVRAEERERIAQAIEAEQFATGLNWKARDAFAVAAQIARSS